MRPKTLLALVVAFATGIGLGWFASPTLSTSTGDQTPEPALTADLQALEQHIDQIEADRERLRTEQDRLLASLTTLQDEQSLLQAQLTDMLDQPLDEPASPEAQPDPTQEEREARRLQRRERMEEMRDGFQDRMTAIFDEQFAQLDDPEAIDRLAALEEWRAHQQDLQQEFMAAESDEDREAIRADMQEARKSANNIVRAQQNDLFRELAQANGITGRDEQRQFVTQLRETLQDPFFRMERMLTGGGGPGGWGGPAGLAGPGGRRGRR